MIRILLFLLVIFALGLGFSWLADRPGDMVVTFDGYRYEVSLMVAAAAIVAVTAAAMILWWLAKSIWDSPAAIARFVRVRRRDRGYQALSTGMIAAGAGDAAEARRLKKQAMKLIRSETEPLLHLLDAQASLLEGDHDAARRKFEAMLDDPEMRLLGLRGLYLEAERLGDRDAASHYAERAAEQAPQLSWASSATLEARTGAGEWDDALRLLEAQRATRQIDRDVANRRRAVLLTAKAIEILDTDPLAAKNAAVEANRLAPELVPAAVMAARALVRQNDLRRAARILETAWRHEPHPEIAQAYVHARPGDSTHDRLARARKLQAMRRNNAEAELALARAALDAGEFAEARSAAEAAARVAPSEGAYLLLADIEEAETGDAGRIRQWLGKAVRAPADAAWVADGVAVATWSPVSPVTGRLDAFEWRRPVERLGAAIEADDGRQPVAALPPAVVIEPAPGIASSEMPLKDPAPGDTRIAEAPPRHVPPENVQSTDAPPADPLLRDLPQPEKTPPQPAAKPVPAKAETPAPAPPVNPAPAPPAPAAAGAPIGPVAAGPVLAVANDRTGPGEDDARKPPDDPGVDPDDEDGAEPRRFRLF